MQADEPANITPPEGHSPTVSDDASPNASVEHSVTSSVASVVSSIPDASPPVAALPLGLLDSVGSISISGATGESAGGSASGAELNLGFNVDALSLEGLAGFDFDMASILSQ
ncbi:hypothetical protein GGF42_008599, partial [Coemansia sp. RSA 2424]